LCPDPKRGAIERHRRQERRLGTRQGAVEEIQAPLVRERRDAATAHTSDVPVAEARGKTLALPQAPGDRGRGEAFGAALQGEGVEVTVGGGVSALAGGAEEAGDRREADEVGQLRLPGQLVQVAGATGLGGEDALDLLD